MADKCPDTCCEGWRVGIDKRTYDKYQESTDPILQPGFQKYITINEAGTNNDQYASFVTSGGRCSFVSEGLCSIQVRLGESYLGAACASFPRVTNLVNGALERSLDASCPEAARLALLDPAPLQFVQVDPNHNEHRVAAATPNALDPQGFSNQEAAQIREFVRWILQNRKYPVAKRLVLLGHVCDKLKEISVMGRYAETNNVVEGFSAAISAGLFDGHLRLCIANPAKQLEIVLELVVERVKSDFTHQRFLQLYQNFLAGILWVPDATLPQLGLNYSDAYQKHYSPFMSQHEYLLEHYLVNNAFKTLFPFGSRSLNCTLGLNAGQSMVAQYLLLTVYYSLVKAILIGVAAPQCGDFTLDVALSTIQICSKTFEHSVAFPKRMLEILASHGITNPAQMSVLTQN